MPADMCSSPGQTLFVLVLRTDVIWVLCVLERRGMEEGHGGGAVDHWCGRQLYLMPWGSLSGPKSTFLIFLIFFIFYFFSSWDPAFTVCIRTENQDQASFCPSAPREVSVLPELALGHVLPFDRCTAPVKLPTWHCPQSGSRPAGTFLSFMTKPFLEMPSIGSYIVSVYLAGKSSL